MALKYSAVRNPERSRYHLQPKLIMEDLAGKSIGRPFELDEFERVDDGINEIPFGPID